jgi:hypothetical protein
MRFMPTPGVIMNASLSSRFIAAGALAVAAFGAASAAHAHADVSFFVGVQGAPVYMEPAPAYVQPRPVYVQPQPVYAQPPVYAAPAEMYGRTYAPRYDDGYEAERAWRRAEWHRRRWMQHHHEGNQYPSGGRGW